MQGKQRIPGYMKNDINKKPKVKYIEIILDVMGKIPGILPLYVTALGTFHIFLWAFNVSSGSIGDTAFIIQKEGVGGGVSRILALIVPHLMMLLIGLFPNVVFVGYGIWVYGKTRDAFNGKIAHFLYSFAFGFLAFICALYFTYLGVHALLNGGFVNNFYFNESFGYWIEPENIIPQIIFVFILIWFAILAIFFIRYRENSNDALIYRIILRVFISFVLLSPFFMFGSAYSKGYGTECVSLEAEDNMIVESSARMGNEEEGKKILKISEVIQSGGGYIADILSEGKGSKNYVLSSYVYSEDKDYLNIMVFSMREWYKDDRGNDRTGNDLLIDKKGEGRNGVLVSIKKSSIKNRFISFPLCFNGK